MAKKQQMVQGTFSDACPLVSHFYQNALRADPGHYYPSVLPAFEAGRPENRSRRCSGSSTRWPGTHYNGQEGEWGDGHGGEKRASMRHEVGWRRRKWSNWHCWERLRAFVCRKQWGICCKRIGKMG